MNDSLKRDGIGVKAQLVRSAAAPPPRMPLPHKTTVPKPQPPEDPLYLFPSEYENTVRLRDSVGERCADAMATCKSAVSVLRGFHPPWLRFPAWRLLTWRPPTLPLSMLRVSAWRLPTRGLPAWPDGAWRVLMAALLSQARSAIGQSVVHTSVLAVLAVTVSAFAFGVVVGGSAVWLSRAARPARVETTAPRQTPRAALPLPAPPVAPIVTALATTPVHHRADYRARSAPATKAAEAADTATGPFLGSLVVNSLPSGARVFVNGRSVGETPLVLRDQPAGSRAIRVALDGYEPWSSAVQVIADSETRLRAELKAQR